MVERESRLADVEGKGRVETMSGTNFLSEAEVAQFREQGYLIPKYKFSPVDVEELRVGIASAIERFPQLTNLPLTTAHFPSYDEQGNDQSLMSFCLRDDLLDIIESLEGPDLVLWTTTVFHRPPVKGVATPFHQDGEYWPISPMTGSSAWIAVTPTRRANGCMRVIPGSHRMLGEHVENSGDVFGTVLSPDAFDEAAAVDIELDPGQMLLFHPYLIHGSWPNTSDDPRTGFAVRYYASTSVFDLDGGAKMDDKTTTYDDRALFLVRGVDRSGRNDFQRNHDFKLNNDLARVERVS